MSEVREVSKINLYGNEYTIKDNTARTNASNAQSTANSAQTTANSAKATATSNTTKIANVAKETIVISYSSSNESIDITKGITV